MNADEPWFAVKCLFSHPALAEEPGAMLYEERITLWRAKAWDEAFAKASEEAVTYARENECEFLRASNAFHLFDGAVGEGTEVWSLMRESNLSPDLYEQTFSVTPRDRMQK